MWCNESDVVCVRTDCILCDQNKHIRPRCVAGERVCDIYGESACGVKCENV